MTAPTTSQPFTLRDALEHVRSTLKLRHIDEASDEQVEEAIRIADEALAEQSIMVTLRRAEFLMRRASEGDHQALEKLADAARGCRVALAAMGAMTDADGLDDQED